MNRGGRNLGEGWSCSGVWWGLAGGRPLPALRVLRTVLAAPGIDVSCTSYFRIAIWPGKTIQVVGPDCAAAAGGLGWSCLSGPTP
eukprot:351801-Chlamydomonas_euryale.AAC.13